MPQGDDREQLVSDADVLMNLLASGRSVEILNALNVFLLVPVGVAQEALYLEGTTVGTAREAIDLGPLIEAGLLSVTRLAEKELNLMIELAKSVGDGEAEAIAMASARTLPLASDDRKAGRLAESYFVALRSTPDLLAAWQRVAAVPDTTLREALHAIERRSRYRPSRRHSLHEWWIALTEP